MGGQSQLGQEQQQLGRMGERVVAVCSRIPGLAKLLRATLLPGYQVIEIQVSQSRLLHRTNLFIPDMMQSGQLTASIRATADFLVAEHGELGPLLGEEVGPGTSGAGQAADRLQWVQNTWAGVDTLPGLQQVGHV